jgi:hypothetical protein
VARWLCVALCADLSTCSDHGADHSESNVKPCALRALPPILPWGAALRPSGDVEQWCTNFKELIE